jgi:hypothetical protein
MMSAERSYDRSDGMIGWKAPGIRCHAETQGQEEDRGDADRADCSWAELDQRNGQADMDGQSEEKQIPVQAERPKPGSHEPERDGGDGDHQQGGGRGSRPPAQHEESTETKDDEQRPQPIDRIDIANPTERDHELIGRARDG